MAVVYSQAELETKYNRLFYIVGEYSKRYATARKAGNKKDIHVYRKKAMTALGMLFAMDGWDCNPNGDAVGIFNPYTNEDLGNIVSYISKQS